MYYSDVVVNATAEAYYKLRGYKGRFLSARPTQR